MKDLFSEIKVMRAVSPGFSTTDTAIVSQVIDREGFESLTFAIATGVLGDSNATFTVLIEDSDTDFSGTAVDDTLLLGTEAGASFQYDDDNECRKIGYLGAKRYVRLTITPSGNSGSPDAAFYSAVAILGGARKGPLTTQAT